MRRLIVCVLLLASLEACALTTDEVNLQYHSAVPQNAAGGASGVEVQVIGTEGRSSDLHKVSVKKNGYGMEMAPIIANQSLPNLVKVAVQEELTKEGFKIGPGAVVVSIELDKFYNDFKIGFWAGHAASEVTILAKVKAQGGRIFYARSITGNADVGGMVLADGANATLSLDNAFSACVARLIEDPEFTRAILAASHTSPAVS